jgi:methylated-DNA-[protein]-cysteine S-methyltransferase
MPQLSTHSPLGDLTVTEEDGEIISLDWGWGRDQTKTPVLEEAVRQLNDYFDDKRENFDLPLNPAGTPFQKAVWDEMLKIPKGGTKTYGQLSDTLKSAARAVGVACGANPIPIIIPCHRILAANGLGGFSAPGGVDTKIELLRFERVLL